MTIICVSECDVTNLVLESGSGLSHRSSRFIDDEMGLVLEKVEMPESVSECDQLEMCLWNIHM